MREIKMSEKRYSLGLDFGTLSARAVLADVENGDVLPYEAVFYYPHAIIHTLDNNVLPSNYAIQHPQDYIDALKFLICETVSKNKIPKESVIGIGIDFTDCSFLPVNKDFTPMCMLDKYKNNPHAYVKIWKHHAKEEYTKKILKCAQEYDEKLLSVSGNTLTSEFFIPKLYETFCEARDLYENTDKFIFAGDFITSLLIGKTPIHSKAFSAKQHYNDIKYPRKEFFALIDKEFENVYEEKTVTTLTPPFCAAGKLCKEWAEKTGLCENVAVSAPIIDAYGAISASGINKNRAVLVLGTSAVLEAVITSKQTIKGLLVSSYESIAPKMTTIEAGLAAMGDLFEWFIKNCLPCEYSKKADELGLSPHQYLRSLSQPQKIGAHGLIALDWWNGCRSMNLSNTVSGTIIGLKLSTKPEDIYRALIESTAFGIRRILDCLSDQGITFSEIFATGGISLKDPMLMQICADVFNIPIFCLSATQATALGSAIYGAVAAGVYDDITVASKKMSSPIATTYYPIKDNHEKYETIYLQYKNLFDYYNKSNDNIMTFLSQNKL